MIKKTMYSGNFAAEFHLDDKSQPPLYRYAIIQRHTRTLLAWGREDSVPDAMRAALEMLERFNTDQKLDEATKLSRQELATLHSPGKPAQGARLEQTPARPAVSDHDGHHDEEEDDQAMRAAS
jgi:hypothetical protein